MSTKTAHFIISDGLVFISDLGHLKFFSSFFFLNLLYDNNIAVNQIYISDPTHVCNIF